MKKVLFYVSEKVLLGEVACKYCLQKHFPGFNSLQFHFSHECQVEQCNKDNCDCSFCDPDIELIENDGFNVYLNKFTIKTYFENGPFQFWGVIKPHFIVRANDGSFVYEENSPACAA